VGALLCEGDWDLEHVPFQLKVIEILQKEFEGNLRNQYKQYSLSIKKINELKKKNNSED
tara:strand:+ start:177 stop:353 length:177 start_codon:yes stop_codon:yes gene_type:complete